MSMYQTLWSTLLVVGLAGCAAQQASMYGNFLGNAPVEFQQPLVDAAVQQLAALYPPGRTRFDLQQATPDAFGLALVAALRAKGYGLQEFKPAAATVQAQPAETGGQPLAYLLDQAAGADLYRLTLVLGNQSLSRVYVAQQGRLQPAGAWVRKE
jgi:hypothetical protein